MTEETTHTDDNSRDIEAENSAGKQAVLAETSEGSQKLPAETNVVKQPSPVVDTNEQKQESSKLINTPAESKPARRRITPMAID